jgi:hypothetical protein
MALAYHGSTREILKFTLQDKTGHDQYGPGVYFASEISTAKAYGTKMHIVEIDTKRFIHHMDKVDVAKITRLCQKASVTALSNWDANRLRALKMLTAHCLNADTMHEALNNVWSDVFALDSKKAATEFAAAGIDGSIVPVNLGVIYYLVFNCNTVKILDVQRV